jgi:hypothetical protein
VRARADDALLPVPSPTYLLLQAYEEHAGPCVARCATTHAHIRTHATHHARSSAVSGCAARRPVHHYDLYRLRGPEDMRNLELADSFARGARASREQPR